MAKKKTTKKKVTKKRSSVRTVPRKHDDSIKVQPGIHIHCPGADRITLSLRRHRIKLTHAASNFGEELCLVAGMCDDEPSTLCRAEEIPSLIEALQNLFITSKTM